MKKLFLLLALCVSARADVLVYKVSGTYTLSGGGTVTRGPLSGWTIIDPHTREVIVIATDTKAKTFRTQSESFYFSHVGTSATKTATVMGRADGLRSYFAKGVNVTVDIGATNLYRVPLAWTWTATAMNDVSLDEGKGVMVFDKLWTLVGQSNSDTAGSAADRLKTFLLGKGYREKNG